MCEEKAMSKKAFENNSLDDIIEAPSVSIDGVLTSVSQLKKSRNQNYCEEKAMSKKAFKNNSLNDIVEAPSVSIHSVLTSVFQLKKGPNQNYFEGKISDGSSKLRVVG